MADIDRVAQFANRLVQPVSRLKQEGQRQQRREQQHRQRVAQVVVQPDEKCAQQYAARMATPSSGSRGQRRVSACQRGSSIWCDSAPARNSANSAGKKR